MDADDNDVANHDVARPADAADDEEKSDDGDAASSGQMAGKNRRFGLPVTVWTQRRADQFVILEAVAVELRERVAMAAS